MVKQCFIHVGQSHKTALQLGAQACSSDADLAKPWVFEPGGGDLFPQPPPGQLAASKAGSVSPSPAPPQGFQVRG